MKTTCFFALLFFSISSFSQNQIDPIIDTGANYLENTSYNTGEVYVIFPIQNDLIVSKDVNEIASTESISIYPNPVSNLLTIVTSGKKKVSAIMLFSLDGRLLLDQKIQNNQVDLTNIPLGSYILKTDFPQKSFKLIKL